MPLKSGDLALFFILHSMKLNICAFGQFGGQNKQSEVIFFSSEMGVFHNDV